MKKCYPILLTEFDDKSGYLVYVPDFDINTSGTDLANTLEMARDAIELCGITYEDRKSSIPEPSALGDVECSANEIKLAVDVDFEAYRRRLDNRSIKKNCTIPSWLNERAEQANINFSAVLQEALKQKLQIN
ncbi:MAG: type II toxin-antitoxin system HicB family antitoxin [Oscillospiraceae bacterium]|nr:type II toxin-antitoxin system HicB family antitoxin [Oscillospiraceae bacterium]